MSQNLFKCDKNKVIEIERIFIIHIEQKLESVEFVKISVLETKPSRNTSRNYMNT